MPHRHHNRECCEPAPQLILTPVGGSEIARGNSLLIKNGRQKKTGGILWMPPVCFFSTFCSQANQRRQEKPLSQ
jgi:hypothetical protein